MDVLISNLQNKTLFPHAVDYFKVIETHISWIILTGQWAYKIKKPVNMGFLDFSTLEQRHFYCQEEIRLNTLLAPEVYTEVIAITGTREHPAINGEGPAIEYAVQMREFSQHHLFDKLLTSEGLTTDTIHQAATIIANFHQNAAIGDEKNPYGTHEQIHEPVVQNFEQIQPFLNQLDDLNLLEEISAWADHQHQKWEVQFRARKQQGFIKECHGDIHLGNIALIEGVPTLFDCIEFNESFRWTDTMADLGFLAMDLEDKKQCHLSHRLINSYLQATGDYDALAILDYYKSYRAIVRAKISLFHHAQVEHALKPKLWQNYLDCISLAKQYTTPRELSITIMHGLPASGKSTLAKQLSEALGSIHISSDIERKRLAGVSATAQHRFDLYEGLYQPNMTELTYDRLAELAITILNAGYPVIIDASFILKKHRNQFMQLAKARQLPFNIIHVTAPLDVLRERIQVRTILDDQISEAYPEVLEQRYLDAENIGDDESPYLIQANVEHAMVVDSVLAQLKTKPIAEELEEVVMI